MTSGRKRSKSADAKQLGQLIKAMRATYARGENVMAYAKKAGKKTANGDLAILVAYDLQAGSYIAHARANPGSTRRWCAQIAEVLTPWVDTRSTLLEVGCGEATTLAGVVKRLPRRPAGVLGFDLSWSRVAKGREWLAEEKVKANLFVADLFNIPRAAASVDVVFTSHALEPNGGMEEAAIRELLRVARRAVVLFEPIYELATVEAKARMRRHGYVRNLSAAASRAGAVIKEHRLLDFIPNPLNPSGVIVLEKKIPLAADPQGVAWQCPLAGGALRKTRAAYVSHDAGIVYPILRGVPMLRAEHAIVASLMACE